MYLSQQLFKVDIFFIVRWDIVVPEILKNIMRLLKLSGRAKIQNLCILDFENPFDNILVPLPFVRPTCEYLDILNRFVDKLWKMFR